MIRIVVALALGVLCVAPAAAQEAQPFAHAGSGAVLPRTIGEQSISLTRDLGTPNDSVVDYAGRDPRESTTVYIFRAAYPDARLWFEQVLGSIEPRIPLEIFEAGPVQPVRAFGSSTPNALQKIYTTDRQGPFRSTSLFVAQAGEWVVKIYGSSPTLDRSGLAARLAAFADAIRFPSATSFGTAAAALPGCPALPASGRAAAPDETRLAVAVGAGAAVLRRSRQPLADGGAGWCRVAGQPSQPPVNGYRRTDGTGGWFILLGDSGRGFTALTSAELGLPGETNATVVVTTPAFVRVAGVYDGLPDPMSTLGEVGQVLAGRGGLISDENGQAVIGSPPSAPPGKR